MKDIGNLTAKRFEEICWRQLLVRALVETFPRSTSGRFVPARVETTICVFSLVHDRDGNQLFSGLAYVDEDPIDFPKRPSRLVGLGMIPEVVGKERQSAIEDVLKKWHLEMPLWVMDEPIVACTKKGREVSKLKPWDFILLQHFARFETKIAYEIEKRVHPQWILSEFFERMVALIDEQNRVWKPIVS